MMMIIESTADFDGIVVDFASEEDQEKFDAVNLSNVLPLPGSKENEGLRLFLCTAEEGADKVFQALNLPIRVLAQQNKSIGESDYSTICSYMLNKVIVDENGEVTGTEPFSGSLPVFAGAEWLL